MLSRRALASTRALHGRVVALSTPLWSFARVNFTVGVSAPSLLPCTILCTRNALGLSGHDTRLYGHPAGVRAYCEKNSHDPVTMPTTPSLESGARSGVSGKPYPHAKADMLNAHAAAHGYTSPFWLTKKQIEKLGLQLREGEVDRGLDLQMMADNIRDPSAAIIVLTIFNADQTTDPERIRQTAEAAFQNERGKDQGRSTYRGPKKYTSDRSYQGGRNNNNNTTGQNIWDL